MSLWLMPYIDLLADKSYRVTVLQSEMSKFKISAVSISS